jgi:hypothetical protein
MSEARVEITPTQMIRWDVKLACTATCHALCVLCQPVTLMRTSRNWSVL